MPAQVVPLLPQGQGAAPTKLSVQGKLASIKSADALLERLRTAQSELARMEQDTVDLRSLKPFTKELISPALLRHKDTAVKASTACCIADMLRLFAPDAPYSLPELNNVFRFFLSHITGTLGSKVDSRIAGDTLYLIDSLSEVKSILLIFELPEAEDLMVDYVRGFLNSARSDLSKNVEICLASILKHLLDEADTIPQDVLDLLLAVFTPRAMKQKVAGHRLAVEVCNASADRLQKEVAKYFLEVIQAAAQEEEANSQQKQFEAAYALIVEINRAVPTLLTSVMPQFEVELRMENTALRQSAVATIGRILAEENENARDFHKRWPAVWRLFLQRATDKVGAVRVSWLDAARGALIRHITLKDDITEAMNDRFADPDDKVRYAAIQTMGSLGYETLLHHIPKKTLLKLSERALDRKPAVQAEALMAMGKIYNKAYPEIERRDVSALHQFAWIPEAMTEAAYTHQQGSLGLAAAFEAQVLPLPEAAEQADKWVNRLLVVFKHLTPRATAPIMSLLNLEQVRRAPFQLFLERCEAYNGGIVSKDTDAKELKAAMEWSLAACSHLLGGERAASDLLALAKLNDKRLLQLIRTCTDVSQDLKTILKTRTEIKKRLEASNADLIGTVFAFLRSASLVFINRCAVPLLARRLQPGEVDYSATQQDLTQSQSGTQPSRSVSTSTTFHDYKLLARKLLEAVCKNVPGMLVPYAQDFVLATASAKDQALSEVSLQALSSVLLFAGDAVTIDRRLVERCGRFILQGTPLEAKYAARFLAVACGEQDVKSRGSVNKLPQLSRTLATRALDQLLEQIATALTKAKDEELVRYLLALGQCTKYAPKLTDNIAESAVRAVVGVILPRGYTGDNDRPISASADWSSDEGMHPWLQAKVLGINLLVKRCMAFSAKEGAVDMVKPVMRLLFQLLVTDEEVRPDTPTGHLARLRLAAAVGLIKLARVPSFDALIGAEFLHLAFAVQDVCFGVRLRFLNKLLKCLMRRQLPSRFNIIGFLSVVDPEAENKSQFRAYVQSMTTSMSESDRFLYFDLALTRLLHLLAHHPDFNRAATQPEDMSDFVAYIDFYLGSLMTSDNVGLYYHLAAKLKTVRDRETMDATDNLYALSELAQLLIKRRARMHGWTIDTYPGKVKLPSDIFAPLPNGEVCNKVYATQFLSDEVTTWLAELGKPSKPKAPRATAADSPQKRKAAAEGRPRPTQKKRRRSSKRNEDEIRASDTEADTDKDEDSGDEADATVGKNNGNAEDDDDAVSELEEEIDLTVEVADGRSARLREKQARDIQARNARRRAKLDKLKKRGAEAGKDGDVHD